MNVFDDPDRHIIVQLRKAVNLHGNYEVIFETGEIEKIKALDAHKALDLYEFSRTTIEKNEISDKLFLSRESFYKVIGQKN